MDSSAKVKSANVDKRYREKKSKSLAEILTKSPGILLPLRVYSSLTCFSEPLEGHPSIEWLQRYGQDVLTGHPLQLQIDEDHEENVLEYYQRFRKLPTMLAVLAEAHSLNISFGETVSACLGLDKLHLTSAENFWAEVLATETSNGSGVFESKNIAAVILPSLHLAKAPAAVALQSLRHWCFTHSIETIPSLDEYEIVNCKELLLKRCQARGIPIIPSRFVDRALMKKINVEVLLGELKKEVESRDLGNFVVPNGFIAKPTTGGCKEGFTTFRRVADLLAHVRHIGNEVDRWIIQPEIEYLEKTENRVYLAGDALPMLVYIAFTEKDPKDQNLHVICCRTGEIYSNLFDAGGAMLADDPNAGPTSTWGNTVLYDKLIAFARGTRDAFIGINCKHLARLLCRVDIACMFPKSGVDGDGNPVFDIQNPVLAVNEIENFNVASPCLDLFAPGRDSLAVMTGALTANAKICRQQFQGRLIWQLAHDIVEVVEPQCAKNARLGKVQDRISMWNSKGIAK